MVLLHPLRVWLSDLRTALLHRPLALHIRLRLLALLPFKFLTTLLSTLPHLLHPPYSTHFAPTRGPHSLRYLLFSPPPSTGAPRPLHITFHSGGFIGGIPESNIPFAQHVARKTGAVVLSSEYRLAPKFPYPGAAEDAEDLLRHCTDAAFVQRHNIDPHLITLSGFSAGGNLALGLCSLPFLHAPAETRIKGAVTFYAPIDFVTPLEDKHVPEGMPPNPFAWVDPLYATYLPPVGDTRREEPRCSPERMSVNDLPEGGVMMVVPGKDVLLREQRRFVERMKKEGGRLKMLEFAEAFHGWLELPDGLIAAEEKSQIFDAAAGFLRKVHGSTDGYIAGEGLDTVGARMESCEDPYSGVCEAGSVMLFVDTISRLWRFLVSVL